MIVNPSGLPAIPSPAFCMPGPLLNGFALRLNETCVNGFDPRTSGFARPVGSILYTLNGQIAYYKFGTGNTDWSVAQLPAFTPKAGTNLVDGNAVVSPGNDKASQYTLPAATLTANRTVTLNASSAITGQLVRIVRKDLTANTYTIINNGTNGPNNLRVLAASPGAVCAGTAMYNGVDWVDVGFEWLNST
ncbi:MAG TPA: hypothetical protein VIF11_15785 [Methylomirabilota bacterium]